jgi:hypothetical protein
MKYCQCHGNYVIINQIVQQIDKYLSSKSILNFKYDEIPPFQ